MVSIWPIPSGLGSGSGVSEISSSSRKQSHSPSIETRNLQRYMVSIAAWVILSVVGVGMSPWGVRAVMMAQVLEPLKITKTIRAEKGVFESSYDRQRTYKGSCVVRKEEIEIKGLYKMFSWTVFSCAIEERCSSSLACFGFLCLPLPPPCCSAAKRHASKPLPKAPNSRL